MIANFNFRVKSDDAMDYRAIEKILGREYRKVKFKVNNVADLSNQVSGPIYDIDMKGSAFNILKTLSLMGGFQSDDIYLTAVLFKINLTAAELEMSFNDAAYETKFKQVLTAFNVTILD